MTKRMAFLKNSNAQLQKKWVSEYLHALEECQRQFASNSCTIPKKGAIVLLKEDTKNKALWKLGRVVGNVSGKDGIVRGLKMKLGNGHIIERPLQLVYNMEVGGEDETVKLNPDAKVFIPDGRPSRRAKAEASNQIKGVALYEEDED